MYGSRVVEELLRFEARQASVGRDAGEMDRFLQAEGSCERGTGTASDDVPKSWALDRFVTRVLGRVKANLCCLWVRK